MANAKVNVSGKRKTVQVKLFNILYTFLRFTIGKLYLTLSYQYNDKTFWIHPKKN